MDLIGGFALLGALVGACVGYFFSTYVVIPLAILLVWFTYKEIKPTPRPGGAHSGAIGGHIIATAIFIGFLLGMLITWFFSTNLEFDMQPIFDFVRHYILK